MSPVPFSLRLDPQVKSRLDQEARNADRSASYLAAQAIEAFLNTREARRREIEAAVVEADKGVFISQEAMARWMDSWDTEHELPAPEPDIFPAGL